MEAMGQLLKPKCHWGWTQHCYLCLNVPMSPAAPHLPGSCYRKEDEESISDRQEEYKGERKWIQDKSSDLTLWLWVAL